VVISRQTSTNQQIQQHKFRAPAKPIQPPTPRQSLLGLDKLAQEKRSAAQAAMEGAGGVKKRPRLDDEPKFKGRLLCVRHALAHADTPQVPAIPASRTGNQRQRVEDTPSRGPGLSEIARKKLEEHRKARENQRSEFLHEMEAETSLIDNFIDDGISARNEHRNDGTRSLGDFQQRLNRDSQSGRHGPQSSTQEMGRRSGSSRGVRNEWDATPRDPSGADGNWGGVRNRRWDAPTPRASGDGRLSDDEDDEGGLSRLDMREWEEEQTQLDRDWYMASEDGTLVRISEWLRDDP